jgi:hypothetical protein
MMRRSKVPRALLLSAIWVRLCAQNRRRWPELEGGRRGAVAPSAWFSGQSRTSFEPGRCRTRRPGRGRFRRLPKDHRPAARARSRTAPGGRGGDRRPGRAADNRTRRCARDVERASIHVRGRVTIHPARTRPRFARLEPRVAIDLHEHQIGQRALRVGIPGATCSMTSSSSRMDAAVRAATRGHTPCCIQRSRSLRRESLTSCSLQRFWLRALRVVQILVIAQPLLHGHHDRGAFIALLHAIDEPVDHRNR